MEFSESFLFDNSTLEKLENEENKGATRSIRYGNCDNSKVIDNNCKENDDSDDIFVDESPTNKFKLHRSEKIKLIIKNLTQSRRKLNRIQKDSVKLLPLKKSNVPLPENGDGQIDINDDSYSKFFNSSLEIQDNSTENHGFQTKFNSISNKKSNTQNEKETTEISDDSGGYSKFLTSELLLPDYSSKENQIESSIDDKLNDVLETSEIGSIHINENFQTKELNEAAIISYDSKEQESISEIIDESKENEDIKKADDYDDDNDDDIAISENATFITINSNKISSKNADHEYKLSFIQNELESSKQDINQSLFEIQNEIKYDNLSSTHDNNHNHSKYLNNSRPENIKLNFSLITSKTNNTSKDLLLVNNYQKPIDIQFFREISSWNLPKQIQKQYEIKGISKMFDWQVECLTIPKVLFEQGNLVYSAPTSAGKTLVSEILMIKTIVEKRKKALIILPFISVVREKMYYLQNLLNSSGLRVEGFFGGYSPPGGFDSIHVAICTIEKANSILNRLLEQNKLDDIGIIVMDEIHLISDTNRGYILELLLAKTLYICNKYKNIKIQIVAMSATLSNVQLLQKWLNADLYVTNFRPVKLNEMIKIDTKIYDNQMNLIREIHNTNDDNDICIENDHDHVVKLCLETIFDECSIIIFCPSKDWCEKLCLHIANSIYSIYKNNENIAKKINKYIKKENLEEIKIQFKNIPTGLDYILGKTITYGCAFHHAGLTIEERDLIETGFRNGIIKVIVATSTLSSGVNLPARRVIIRTPLFGGKKMDPLTYKQMIGRAGRTGKDILGESILICNENNAKIGKELIESELKPLSSCLEYENNIHLKRAILEVISSGVATTKQDIELFLSCTLLYTQTNCDKLSTTITIKENSNTDCTINRKSQKDDVNHCIEFLIDYEFIRLQRNDETKEIFYVPTRLGLACLSASIPPTDGIILLSELQKSRRCFVLESELHAVYLVTPYSVCYQLQDMSWLSYLDMWEKLSPAEKKVGELIGIKESFLVKAMRGQSKLDYKLLQIHKRFYIAMALQELVNEIPINKVAMKYNLSRGLLQSLQQMSSTFAGIVTSFCNALNWRMLGTIVSQFKDRLYFGIQNELIDLMRIPDLNSQRARALYNSGVYTLIDLAKSDYIEIEKILHNCLSFDLIKQKDDEDEYEAKKRNNIRNLYVTGKEGITIKDAAKSLISDARKFIQLEMGAKIINWENTQNVELPSGTKNEKNSIRTSTPQTIVTTAINSDISKSLNTEQKSINGSCTNELNSKLNLCDIICESPEHESDKLKKNLRVKKSCKKVSLKSKKILKNQKIAYLHSKTNSHQNKENLNEFLIKSLPSPNENKQSKPRNSLGNKSLEEIENSQPEHTHLTRGIKQHTPRLLRPTRSRVQQQQNSLLDSSTKCLKLNLMSEEEDDDSVSLDLNSNLLQKEQQKLFKHPCQLHFSHNTKNDINLMTFDCLQIIDICENFNLFEKSFNELVDPKARCLGFSIGVERLQLKRKPLIGENLLINQNQTSKQKAEFIFNNDFFISGISICLEKNVVVFINMQRENRDEKITNELILSKISLMLLNKNLTLRIFDAKEQLKILKKIMPHLERIEARIEDPKVAHWLLQPDNEINFKSMVQQYVPKYSAITDVAGDTKTYSSIGLNYKSLIIGKTRSTVESCVVLHVLENQLKSLEEIDNGHLKKFFTDLEMPIQVILYRMESIGFPIDKKKLENLLQFLLDTMKKVENKIYEIHGTRFNLSSSSVVARILGLNKKPNGKISTSKQILEKIDTPISHLIMNYRKLSTTLTKIIHPLNKYAKDENRIFGRSLTFTATGRISMHEPNLQNVTKNFEIDFLGNEKLLISCRDCFVAPKDKYLISADFCQLEMRILAHLSQDQLLLKVMNSDTDIFTAIASKWNKIPEHEVSSTIRNGTKQICYGIIYGMGTKSLSDSLKCHESEAITIMDQFHSAFPGIRAYIDKVVKFARQNGYVETITGRRRYLNYILSQNPSLKAQAERQAINTTIQGSAADISKNSILKLENYLAKYYEKSLVNNLKNEINFVLHLHDELIYEVPKANFEKILKILKLAMENCVKLTVPLKVRLKVGESWGDMYDFKL